MTPVPVFTANAQLLWNLLWQPVLALWPYVVFLVAAGILVCWLGSPTMKGRIGEWRVNRALRQLDTAQYHLFPDLYLPRPDDDGTTQIDHVLVSPFGIFVIETKNYQGWIFGDETKRQWTQQIYRSKKRFHNPLHQNNLHVRALAKFLELPPDVFVPVVFFTGNAEFKTRMPENVINQSLTRWLNQHVKLLLNPEQVRDAVTALTHLDRSTDRRVAAREHRAHVRQRNE